MSQRKLLLADDSITIQKVVNLTFADEGIEVVTVGDGDSAMEKMSDFKPDLILADVNMPGLNGYQICERIKRTNEFNRIPVILLVGSFEPFDELEAKRVGADDFLTKPFQSIRQLVSKVTELLDSGGNGKSFAEPAENENVENQPAASEDSLDSGNAQNNFGDDKLDDEMIQTSANGFGFDQIGKFETKESVESSEDSAKTQPLSPGDLEQFSFAATKEPAAFDDSSADNYPNEQNLSGADQQKDLRENSDAEFSQSSALNFDDDFLELPPFEDEEKSQPKEELPPAVAEESQPAEADLNKRAEPENEPDETQNLSASEDGYANDEANNSVFAETPAQTEIHSIGEQNQHHPSTFAASSELSSETIDIIVQKVVERLSDKVVREIAWEIVPQMTDLIVRKMAEKMKES